MLELILSFDQNLFFQINHHLQNPFLDWLMPIWRNKMTWIPFYLLTAFFSYKQFKIKGLILISFAIGAAGLGDFTSSSLVKPTVQRVRPCNDPEIKESVRLLIPCGSGLSFTSSHATNHFALATFLFFTLGLKFKKWKWLLFIWAGLVAFAQVYVGVHYPLDVFMGGMLGFVIGWLAAFIFGKYFPLKQSVV